MRLTQGAVVHHEYFSLLELWNKSTLWPSLGLTYQNHKSTYSWDWFSLLTINYILSCYFTQVVCFDISDYKGFSRHILYGTWRWPYTIELNKTLKILSRRFIPIPVILIKLHIVRNLTPLS